MIKQASLEQSQNYPAGISKGHVYQNKLQKIQSIDRQVRRRWAKLNNQIRQQQKRQFEKQITQSAQNLKKNFETDMIVGYRIKRIQNKRQQKKQIETDLRHKHYEDVYFSKGRRLKTEASKKKLQFNPKSISIMQVKQIQQVVPKRYHLKFHKHHNSINCTSPSPPLPPLSNEKSSQIVQYPCTDNDQETIPMMLRKPSLKYNRFKQIISNKYKTDLKDINGKKKIYAQKFIDSQKCLFKRIKNSKIYYQMLTQWSPKKYIDHL